MLPNPDPSSISRRAAPLTLSLLLLTWPGCGGRGSGGSPTEVGTTDVTLEQVHYGKLVDVYGLRTRSGTRVLELFQADMLASLDITDQRSASSNRADEDVLYDFLSPDPDTLQPRLLITREIGSPEFLAAVDDLDTNLRQLAPAQFGQGGSIAPFSVVPRNAALRLTFSAALGITRAFFYELDGAGRVLGVKNSEAIQLLQITGDPNDDDGIGDFRPIDVRYAVRDNTIILDPVLLGTEGLLYGSRNTASGMPAAPDQQGANIRLALALEGDLALGKIGEDPSGSLRGRNNDGHRSVIRDFRSGNPADNSPDLARGFIRDPEPPRLIGEMRTYIERVDSLDASTRMITLFKDGLVHEIDRGDQIRVVLPGSTIPLATLEILRDPVDDLGAPENQRVRVLVRPVLGPQGEDLLEALDPFNDPGFPQNGDRRTWLRRNGARAILIAEFTMSRPHPDPAASGVEFYGDDVRNFVKFTPEPLPGAGGEPGPAHEFVSPFAGAILRFSKPIDQDTVLALDTAFFATRNLLDAEQIDNFVNERNLDPNTFDVEKFKTPHLIHSRIFDENGSQTAIRVQPTVGFYLDETMRRAAEQDVNLPFSQRRHHFFLHLVGGPTGIRDLAGNPVDFLVDSNSAAARDNVVIEFSVDTRNRPGTTEPWFDENIVAYVAHRFTSRDEDSRPNYYRDDEITRLGGNVTPDAWPLDDFFGPVSYLPTGELVARSGTRTQRIVDNLNQIAPPLQTSSTRWCPVLAPSAFLSRVQIVNQTAATPFGQPIQNPLNPQGCRLQTCWRDIDMSLSRTDPQDFNLDVERLYWAPFTGDAITFDEFDQISLFLGHSEKRPETCIASGSAFPSFPDSGLDPNFRGNYAANLAAGGGVERRPEPHPAFVDAVLTINARDAIREPRGVNNFLPLPPFEDATQTSTTLKDRFFVWRDEREIVQGGINGLRATLYEPNPYLLGPFMGGRGNRTVLVNNEIEFATGSWYSGVNLHLRDNRPDRLTGGMVGTVGLPLLADFWVYPDSPEKPTIDPFLASGANGWQVSLSVTSISTPNFRQYSGGRVIAPPVSVDPTTPGWRNANGGYDRFGNRIPLSGDNTVYWIMADFIKRTSVVTSGFVEIADPHRMRGSRCRDPRLGPFDTAGVEINYAYDFEPPLSRLPAGTNVTTEFRGASVLDEVLPNQNWPRPESYFWRNNAGVRVPNPVRPENFALDPFKAGDAHIRHFDNRIIPGTGVSRQWWTYMYNRTVTAYTEDPNDLARTAFTSQFAGPNEVFSAEDVRYFNWRFVMRNNVEADPPVSPRIQSFAVAYRLNRR